jgi:hypothetical protein
VVSDVGDVVVGAVEEEVVVGAGDVVVVSAGSEVQPRRRTATARVQCFTGGRVPRKRVLASFVA